MTIALGFLLPLIAYIVLYVVLRKKRLSWIGPASPLAAAGVAIISTLVILAVVFFSPQWPEGTQIAWTSVEANNKPLVVGGAREEAVVGWPNGSFTPSFRVTTNERSQAAIELAGGGAFVRDDDTRTFVNGDSLVPGERIKIADYTFRVVKGNTLLTVSLLIVLPIVVLVTVFAVIRRRRPGTAPEALALVALGASVLVPLIVGTAAFLSPQLPERLLPGWTQKVDIGMEGAGELAFFYLPNAFIGRPKVYTLESQIERTEALASQSEASLRLKQWAAGVRLLLDSDGALRILEREKVWTTQSKLPCKLSVIWPGLTLPIEIRKDDTKLVAEFPPPWRLVSPIPPPPDEADGAFQEKEVEQAAPNAQSESKNTNAAPAIQELPLVVTSRARPNDIAFVLPFGQGIADPREVLTLVRRSGYETIFAPNKNLRSTDDQRDSVPPEYRQSPKVGDAAGVTSKTIVRSGPYGFTLATVHDLPSPQKILGLISVALLCFFGGLVLTSTRMDGDDLWVVCGLAATIWSFLSLRLLLAIRYALAPNHLDQLAVSGVTVAVTGLAVVPGLILLACRLRCDYFARPVDERSRKRIRIRALIYLLILAAALIFEHSQTAHLWANLPEKLTPTISLPFKAALIVLMIYLTAAILLIYKTSANRLPVQTILLGPWCFSADWLSRKATGWWEKMSDGQPTNRFRAIALIVLAFVYFAVIPAALSLVPARKFFQETLVPILFCWPPAIFWLASRRYFSPGGNSRLPSRKVAIACALLTLLPVLFLPVFIRDAGSIMNVLAIFIPVAFLLLSASPRYCGWIASIVLLVAFLAAAVVYLNLRTFFPYLPGEAGVRLLNFKEESSVESYIVFANAVKGEDSGGLPLQKLRNGYQHTWENNAIAHVGGYLGLGFGNAPTRRSQVRQDTLQYDSVFSFFIVSEHGLIGGISLLVLFAVPLALILVSGRLGFDFGTALAALITSAFLFEAIFHAGMNLNAFPFTGRDLPLLAVNSVTDLVRWTILLGAAALAIFWKYDDKGGMRKEAVSIVTPNAGPSLRKTENPRLYLRAVIVIAIAPAVAVAWVAWNAFSVANDSKLDEPFGWDGVLRTTAQVIQEGGVTVDQQTKKLRIDANKLKVTEGMLIEQEVKRFNALPEEERDEETRTKSTIEQVNRVRSFADYNKALDEARRQSLYPAQERRPSLFRLVHPIVWDDEGRAESRGEYIVEPNPDFNIQLSFSTGRKEDEIPRVTLRDKKETIVGPAWVMGHWVLATNTDAPLPWAANLSSAITAQSSRLGAAEASSLYGTLTVDGALQRAALSFVADKGRALYDEILKRLPAAPGSANGQPMENMSNIDQRRKPPRVAISVVSIPDGEAIALGGWPRMTSDRFWRMEDKREWIPPVNWVEGEAPRSLRSLYEGDRNFDRIVMGSATKPIWATAVLGVHPNLDQKLRVSGADGEESEIFGMRLSRKWHVTPSGWRNFNDYLVMSDNRYQVRLGFLGLADARGSDVVPDDGTSNSSKESMSTGQPVAWRAYPKFPEEIRFSKDRLGAMSSLHETALAEQLERMYSIGVVHNDITHRVSFWTKRESDDLTTSSREDSAGRKSGRPTKVFRWISPQAPDFALDKVTNPSDYVTLLLGGGTNLWSNVDFAAAFATCVTGYPVIAHVVRNDQKVETLSGRTQFVEIAKRVQPGLAGVISKGTARGAFQSTMAIGFLSSLKASMGIEAYAKTGTLKAADDARDTSRVVLALIKWKDKGKGIAQAGLVFSVVGEQAQKGTASRWLGEFLWKYQDEIRRLLSPESSGEKALRKKAQPSAKGRR